MRIEAHLRPARLSLWLALVLAAIGGVPARSEEALLSFDRSVYPVEEGQRDLSLRLIVSAPDCGGGGFQVLESTAVLKAEPNGSAVPGDFAPLQREVPLGGSQTSYPVLLPRLVVDDSEDEELETFFLTLRVEGMAQVRCLADSRLLDLRAGNQASVEIEDDEGDDDDGPLQLVKVDGDGQQGTTGSDLPRKLRVKVVREGSGPAVAHTPVQWQAIPVATVLTPLSTLSDDNGIAEVTVTLGPEAGLVLVRASLPEEGPSVTFTLRSVDPDDPIPSAGLCDNLDLLTESARAACRRGEARQIVPGAVAAQAILGSASLALSGHSVRQRLASRGWEAGPVGGGGRPAGGAGAQPSRGGLYAGTGVDSGSRPESAQETGYDFRLRSFQAGFDAFTPRGAFLLGGQLGVVEGEADFHGDGGGLELRAFSATAFALCRNVRQTLFLEGFVTWERPRYELDRVIHLDGERRVARSDASGSQWQVSLGARAERPVGPVVLEGRAYVHFDEVAIDSFRESGARDLDLEVEGRRQRSFAAEVGGRLRVQKAFASWGVLLRAGADAVRELSGGAQTLVWRFADGDPTGPRFSTTTQARDRDYFKLEAGLIVSLPRRWQAFVRAHKEVQRDELDSRSYLFGLLFRL